jgi:hypothetical protein
VGQGNRGCLWPGGGNAHAIERDGIRSASQQTLRTKRISAVETAIREAAGGVVSFTQFPCRGGHNAEVSHEWN